MAVQESQTGGLRIDHLPKGQLGAISVYPKGAMIWGRGDRLDYVCFVSRGQVRMIVEDERSRQCTVRFIKPGEPFGLNCFSPHRSEHAPTSAVADVRSEILKIPCDEFLKFLRGNEKATAALLATMSEYLSYAEERLRIVVNHDAEDRLCALLEQVGERFGRPSREDPAFLRVQLTHQELAELSGLSRSHVSLIMARLRSNGIVRYGRSKPLTLDTGALARRREQRSAH